MPEPPAVIDGPDPAGFGNCRGCAYVETGPIRVCYECASATLQTPAEHRCTICDQALAGPDEQCSNALCTDPDRAFEFTAVIAMKTGALERMIWRVKDGKWAWGYVFSRVVLGYLYAHPELVRRVDAIIPTPALLPAGADPRTDHAKFVIQQAKDQDEAGLPFVVDLPLVVKTRTTTRMRNTSGAEGRRMVSEQLFQSLAVPDPGRVRNKRIMVYDDVFTSGNTLNAVARRLKAAGASEVFGLTLARQVWSGGRAAIAPPRTPGQDETADVFGGR
ncbi:ComF family protein [Micromonospora sp. CB01531]|uniref:ComF family protein n=1 Tax=Micromonospora sp. CB01531 TaxID=1718947 RepID=UPI00093BDDAF|nr:phosphoribosyltransferase family protein [Micromonospora sp. CB01531]